MPSKPFFDLSRIDAAEVTLSRDEIYQVIPHRYEFQQLDGIYFIDEQNKVMCGYRDVRDDEFWVRGHIPGRPIFPGVLMIETAAQLVAYYANRVMSDNGFLGFSGVEKVKFRGQVVPGQRIIMMGQMLEIRSRRCIGATQAYVDGKQVYEGIITGMWI